MFDPPTAGGPARPLVVVKFAVPGGKAWEDEKGRRHDPMVSKNTLRINVPIERAPRGRILSAEGRAFIAQIGRIAKAAGVVAGWPRSVFTPKDVCVTVQPYGTRHDPGAFDEVVRDALQGVLYHNDRCARGGPQNPPLPCAERKLVVTVELFAVHTPLEAGKRERDAAARAVKRLQTKGRRVF